MLSTCIPSVELFRLFETLPKMFYEDDHFHPNNVDDDYADDEYYQVQYNSRDTGLSGGQSVASADSYRKRQRSNMDGAKMLDKGYHKINVRVDGRKTDIEFYHTSNTPGMMIRDAVTGSRYSQYRVGSKNEDQFFKVHLAFTNIDFDSKTVFYDSPEQYERHMMTKVSQECKDKWSNKCAIARKLYAAAQDEKRGDFTFVK